MSDGYRKRRSVTEVWRQACYARGLLGTQRTGLSCLWGHSPGATFSLASSPAAPAGSRAAVRQQGSWSGGSPPERRAGVSVWTESSVLNFASRAFSRRCFQQSMLFPEPSSAPPPTPGTDADEGRAEGLRQERGRLSPQHCGGVRGGIHTPTSVKEAQRRPFSLKEMDN